ncbi:DUF1177 family protein [Alicyclobacillus sp. SO9]|nr:DUF1177 family protein [Alicyclobacillus sp. SO9]
MGSPVDMLTKNEHEVSPKRDAILSIDTTKGNRVFNHHGIADFCCQKEQGITDFSEVAPGRQPFHAL